MACGDAGRFANADNLLSQCARFLLAREQAQRIVDEMASQVRGSWFATAREAGVSPADCDRIAGAFVYEGFRRSAG
jgi:serine/threonine-protein kinase HipA